jgi:hypothetical protein
VTGSATFFFGVFDVDLFAEVALLAGVGFFAGAGDGDFFFADAGFTAGDLPRFEGPGDFPFFVVGFGAAAGDGDLFTFAGVLLRVTIILGDLLLPLACASGAAVAFLLGVFVAFFVLMTAME